MASSCRIVSSSTLSATVANRTPRLPRCLAATKFWATCRHNSTLKTTHCLDQFAGLRRRTGQVLDDDVTNQLAVHRAATRVHEITAEVRRERVLVVDPKKAERADEQVHVK